MGTSRMTLPATATATAPVPLPVRSVVGQPQLTAPRAMLGGVPVHTAVSPVFVGRSAELAVLTEALTHASEGSPQALLLGGEAGVGKTRLLEEFLRHAETADAVSTVGGCLELGADGLPFAPFTIALRGLLRSLGSAVLAEAGEGRESELARLLPDAALFAPAPAQGPGRDEEDDGDRARLFEAVAQLLEQLAAERTVVLVLEDLQWADRSTRELLAYLFRTVRTCRLVLLASYRSDDIHRRHPLRPFLAEQDRLRAVLHLELPRLTRPEVTAQMTGIRGSEPEPALAEAVFRRSQGIPFFVEELTSGCPPYGMSRSLRDLLLVRVEALPEQAQHVVRLAAQAGSAVEHALLAAVCGLEEDALLEALRAAVGGNVLRPTEDDAGYTFRHALLREAVTEDLLPGELRRTSRRYATALEADPSLVRAEERGVRLAEYWYRGHDPAKALPAALTAATEAHGRHAYAEEHHLLERVIELWDEVPEDVLAALPPLLLPRACPRSGADGPAAGGDKHRTPGPPRFVDVLAAALIAARTGGEAERALLLARRALALLDEAHEPLLCAWFQIKSAMLTEDLGRGDGRPQMTRAQELVRGLPPSAVHAEVLSRVAHWGLVHRPGPDALAAAFRAVELARVVGATSVELASRTTLGILLTGSGDLRQGLEEMVRVRDEAAKSGYISVTLRAAVNIAVELEAVGRSAQAATEAERALRIVDGRGRPNHHAAALTARAEALLSTGHWDAAARLTERARAVARAADVRGWAALLRARLAAGRGDLAVLEAAVEEAHAALGTAPANEPQKTVALRHLSMVLAAARGGVAALRTALEPVLAEGFGPGTHRYAWPLLHSAAAHEASARGLPAAEPGRPAVLDAIRRAARRLPRTAPVWEAYALLVEAELGRAEGAAGAAVWSRVADAFAPLERPHLLARARLRWAEALLDARTLPGSPSQPPGATEAGRGRTEPPVEGPPHSAGADGAPPSAADPAVLLRRAHATAVHLGALPLRTEAEQLATRARIELYGTEPVGTAADGSARGEHPVAEAATAPPGPEDPAADAAESFGLTGRERDVLELLAEGRSNRQIAERLHISPKTASVHVSHILAKLGVTGRGEAAAMAFRLRLVSRAATAVDG